MSGAVQIASAVACISAIASLANQSTAKKGNFLGIAGVGLGVASCAADMSLAGAGATAYEVLGASALAGGGVGSLLAGKVGPTELPQTVAGFHSLVGLAAMLAAIGEFFELGDAMGGKTAAAVYLATFIGGITFTGSLVAFGKLSQMLGSSPLKLPGRDLLNLSGLGIGILGLAAFIDPNLVGNLVGGGGLLQAAAAVLPRVRPPFPLSRGAALWCIPKVWGRATQGGARPRTVIHCYL